MNTEPLAVCRSVSVTYGTGTSQVKALDDGHLRAITLPMLFAADSGGAGLRVALDALCARASEAVANGYSAALVSAGFRAVGEPATARGGLALSYERGERHVLYAE